MSTPVVIVEGTVKADGSLELQEGGVGRTHGRDRPHPG